MTIGTTPLTLDELPRFSPWPKRLLGLAPWTSRGKSREQVDREFEAEKWGPLLRQIEDMRDSPKSIAELDDLYQTSDDTAVLDHGQLYLMDRAARRNRYLALVRNAIVPFTHSASALVELGAGYGRVLLGLAADTHFRHLPLIAGEPSVSGRKLLSGVARELAAALQISDCDLESDKILPSPPPRGSIILTSFSLMYLSHISPIFFRTIASWKPRAVIFIEPCQEHFDANSLLGLLQLRYLQLNSYCPSIARDIEQGTAPFRGGSLRNDPAIFGENPLLPGSFILWETEPA